MNHFFSHSSQKLELSPLQIALKNTTNKNLIPFTLGMPDNKLLKLISLDAFTSSLEMDLQYKPPSHHLKIMIKNLVEFQSIKCQESQIFLTNGAQQAISLLLKLLCDPGDSILTEEVTYPGLLQAAQTQNIKLIPIKSSFKNGIDVISLEKEILRTQIKPKLLYIVPNGHNPLSLSLSYQARKEIIRIAQKYHLAIIEDDPYGFLSYDKQVPSLQSIEPTLVAHIGTFSKILGPSLRCGWTICPPGWIEKLEILKEAMDLNTETFSQTLISHFLKKFPLNDHIITLQKAYKSKRDFLAQQLKHGCVA